MSARGPTRRETARHTQASDLRLIAASGAVWTTESSAIIRHGGWFNPIECWEVTEAAARILNRLTRQRRKAL